MSIETTTPGHLECLDRIAAVVGEPNLIVDRDLVAGYSVEIGRAHV